MGFVNILGLLVGNLGESTQPEFCQGFQSGKSTDVQMFLIDEETELLPAGSSRPVCRGQQQLSAGILSEASLLALVFSSPWPRVQVQSPWPLVSGMVPDRCKPVMVIPVSFVVISVGEACDFALTREPPGKVCWGFQGWLISCLRKRDMQRGGLSSRVKPQLLEL